VLMGVKPHSLTNFHDMKTVIGCGLVALGLALRSWAAGTLHKDSQLTTSGPYGIIRNPLYVGSFMLMIGFCTIVDDAENIWFVLGPFVALYVIRVLREERTLASLFGDQWPGYVRSVPRFFPRRFPKISFANWDLSQWRSNREYRTVSAVCAGLLALQAWRLY
jgi:protein-S-isoprenylcysteine O-methyltransferase Ste14